MKSKNPQLYGHSIKNIHIKHAVTLKKTVNGVYDVDQEKFFLMTNKYLCGYWPITPEKVVFQKKDVTCKNCLRKLGEKEICANCGYMVDDWVVIEDPDEDDLVMKTWVHDVGMKKGDIICSECYLK